MSKMKKGDAVLMFRAWDNKGTVQVTRWLIGSIGKQRVHLTSVEGNLKHRLYTKQVMGPFTGSFNQTFLILEQEATDPQAMALEFGRLVLDYQRRHFTQCLEVYGKSDQGYRRAIEDEIARLHDPQVLDHRAAA